MNGRCNWRQTKRRKPLFPPQAGDAVEWLGATIKSTQTEGEKSATGIFEVTGVLFVDVPPAGTAAEFGLTNLTVVTALKDRKVRRLKDFLALLEETPAGARVTATLWRAQEGKSLTWTR